MRNLMNQRFGRLIALYPIKERKNGYVVWKCLCNCGNLTNVRSNHLISGAIKSCGCFQIKDLTNQRFDRLVALFPINERTKTGKAIWMCQCDCGNLIKIRSYSLINGNTRSCGCLQKEWMSNNKPALKHGDTAKGKKLQPYTSWVSINQRCFNLNDPSYKYYGGRRISVCDEWRDNYLAFKDWALANGYQKDLTIDRINNNGDYEPNNCQWITRSENTKKANKERELNKPI